MKMRIKRLLGILLSFSLVMGTMPGAPLTIHAGELKTSEKVSSDTAVGEEGRTEDKAPVEEGNREDTASGNEGVKEPEVPSVPAVPEPEEEESAKGSEPVSEDTVPEEPVSVSAPVVSEPEIEENAGDGEHINHNEITFTAWDSDTSLPTEAGNYYLTKDVTLTNYWSPAGTTNLCLNGYGIRVTGDNRVIFVPSGSTLNIYDCKTTEHFITLDDYRGVSVSNNGTESGIDFNGDGTIRVTGGYITGGNVNAPGAGIEICGGTFNMYGGTIIGNKSRGSGYYGGGVAIDFEDGAQGSFLMDGGKIIFNYTEGKGGAVYVHGSNNDTFTMTGGVISGNRAGQYGGAVYLENSKGIFNLNGGLITNNKAGTNGGAVYWSSSAAKVNTQGNPVVRNNTVGNQDRLENLYLRNNFTIPIAGTLDSDASIGVTMENHKVFTSGLSGKGTAKNFKSDKNNLAVSINASGEAELVHGHIMTYSVSGATITATCSNNNPTCTLPGEHKVTLTIMKPDRTIYGDGKSASASFNGLDDFNAATGFETTVSDISSKAITNGAAGLNYRKGLKVLPESVTLEGYYETIVLKRSENFTKVVSDNDSGYRVRVVFDNNRDISGSALATVEFIPIKRAYTAYIGKKTVKFRIR